MDSVQNLSHRSLRYILIFSVIYAQVFRIVCFLRTFELKHVWVYVSSIRVISRSHLILLHLIMKKKLRGLSPRANYTDRAAAAGQRSWCQLLRIEGCHVVSATDPHEPLISIFWTGAATFLFK